MKRFMNRTKEAVKPSVPSPCCLCDLEVVKSGVTDAGKSEWVTKKAWQNLGLHEVTGGFNIYFKGDESVSLMSLHTLTLVPKLFQKKHIWACLHLIQIITIFFMSHGKAKLITTDPTAQTAERARNWDQHILGAFREPISEKFPFHNLKVWSLSASETIMWTSATC